MRAHAGLFLLLLLSALCASYARAGGVIIAGKHPSISVVPAPGPVTINGKLDDWDLSGEILTYEFVETAEKRHARTAMMYDAQNLYIAVTFADDTPMMNMVDGKIDPSRGWDADAYQVRLINDPTLGYPINVTKALPVGRDCIFWYFTGRKEPWLSITNVTFVPPGEAQYDFPGVKVFGGADAGAAFQRVDGGYVMEAKIPWTRLGMTGAPAPGTKLAMTSQHLWGNDTGTRYATSVNDITAPGGGFTYQCISGWGYALFEPAGKLARAREELPTAREVAQTQSFTYTLPEARHVSVGLFDATGNLVRTLLTDAPRPAGTTTEHWDGLNDFGDLLPAGAYTAKMLTHTGITQDWVVSLHNSGTPPWVTADGTGSWGGDHGVPLDAACAPDRVFLLWDTAEAGWNLIGCSLDGRKQWGTWCYQNYPSPNALATDGSRVYVSQQAGITVHDAATGKPCNFANGARGLDVDGGGVTDLAYRDGQLFTLGNGKVTVIQLSTCKTVRSFPVGAGAKGLAVVPGTPYLLTTRADGTVCRLDPRFGTCVTLFSALLVHPFDVAVSADGQRIYVSDQGRGQMTVKVFSYPAGKALGTVGKPGGRPALGKYDPNGLFMPGGIAFDAKGRLWVTEMDQTPKRVSVWLPSGKQGKLAKEFFGASDYAVGVSADPAQPEYAYLHNTRWIVDYDKKTAKLDCTFVRPGYDGLQPTFSNGWMGEIIRIRHVQGRTFLCAGSSVWELHGDRAVPIAAMCWLPRAANWPVPDYNRPDNWAYVCYWSDLNGDGFMQPEEIELVRGGESSEAPALNMGDDLALEIGTKRVGVKEWRHGLPIWFKPQEIKAPFTTIHGNWPVCWNPAHTRCISLDTNDGYYTNDMRKNGIGCYAPDGTRLWRFKAGIGMDLNAPLTKPGEIRGAERVIGFAPSPVGEIFGVNGYYGNYNFLTEDGLFITELCHDNRRGHPLDGTVLCPEGFSGYFLQHPKSKKYYLYGGDSDGRIWEVKGLETLRQSQFPLAITADDAAHAAQALAAFQQNGGGAAVTTLRHVAKPVLVDGALDEWDFTQAVSIAAGPGRGGKAMAAYDDTMLYLAYRVADDSPFVNGGGDWAYLFKTGDLVDLMLCTTAGADPARKAGAGDLRLILAPFQGKPTAILNQKVADGGPAAPLKFTSPGQFEEYARVTTLPGAVVAVKTNPDGYTLEAAVPLAALGFTPKAGMNYPIDFGILYGDPAGAKTIMRAYWANQHTSIIGDIPTESRITPANLGTARVE